MVDNSISKDQSFIIKGIAILLMLIHHFFTFPQWIIGGGYECNLITAEIFNEPTKLCVCLFAFVSGWAFSLGSCRFTKLLKKIFRLYIAYWYITLPAILIGVLICNYRMSAIEICAELLGLARRVMLFNWYVPFYAISLLLIYRIKNMLDDDIKRALLIGIALPILFFTVLKEIPSDYDVQRLFSNLRHWFPCIAIGYICNKYKVFEKINGIAKKYNCVLFSIILIFICFVGRYFLTAIDFIYGVVFVYAILNLKINPNSLIGKFILICGKNSTNIWFLHCLYFGEATRELFQPYLYWCSNPLLIYMTALIVLLGCSILLSRIRNYLLFFIRLEDLKKAKN